MPTLQFRGLVRAMNHVRTQLAAGIPADEVGAFRDYVNQVLHTVERGCKNARQRPEDLAAPSYRAYRFLKSVDLRHLPVLAAGSQPATSRVQVAQVVAVCHGMQIEIADLMPADDRPPDPADARIEALRQRMAWHAAEIERLCREQGGHPGDLGTRSRRGFEWLRFLSGPGRLVEHLGTLALASRIGRDRLAGDRNFARQGVRQLVVDLAHSNTLVRGRRVADSYEILLHQGLSGAPREVVAAAVRAAMGERDAMRVVKDYALTKAFRAIGAELEGLPGTVGVIDDGAAGNGVVAEDGLAGGGGNAGAGRNAGAGGTSKWEAARPRHRTAGRHHDLAASFERVNRQYFDGRMPRPTLTWNATITHRKLGHYNLVTDTVLLSVTLDDPRVPDYVVDFVMYHELLHKQLGVRAVNGRQRAHTPEFRRAERRFHEFRRAEDFLRRLGQRVDL